MGVAFNFGANFQTSLLVLMITNEEFAYKCAEWLDASYFISEAHSWVFNQVKRKIKGDHSTPSFLELEEAARRHKSADIMLPFIEKLTESNPVAPDFIKDSLTEFVRRSKFYELHEGIVRDYNEHRDEDAYSKTLNGIQDIYNVNFSEAGFISASDFEQIRRFHIMKRLRGAMDIPTGIDPLDEILKGGLSKGELGCIMAIAKQGKSITLIHMGYAALSMGHKVMHVVCEGTSEQTIFRYQSRMSGLNYNDLEADNLEMSDYDALERAQDVMQGKLVVVPFNVPKTGSKTWRYTVGDILSKLDELSRQGFQPDLLVVDYADLLGDQHGGRETFDIQANVFRDLKTLAMMRSIGIWTASQSRRPERATRIDTLGGQDISASYEKVRILDFLATLNQTAEERVNGVMRLHADIYRNNDCGDTINLITDFAKTALYNSRYGIWKERRKKAKSTGGMTGK